MTATLATVPATTHGVVCSRCSYWANGTRVQVRHASLTAVRLCYSDGNKIINDHTGTTLVNKINNLPPVPSYADRMAGDILAAEGRTAEAAESYAASVDVVPTTASLPEVPAGRYAVRALDGVVKFYKIDKPTEGRWAGRTFVNVQASDALFPIKNSTERRRILAAILVDVRGASTLYGRELGRCGVCGRTLTDPESIAAGIGPICDGKL